MKVNRREFVAFAAAAVLCLAGCSAEPEAEKQPEAPASYVGEWTQADSNGESWQEAVVADGRIEVYWMTPDSKSIYWIGTFDPEGDGVKISERDKEATENALLASGADTKDFNCADDAISYDVSAMGMTKTLRLVRK